MREFDSLGLKLAQFQGEIFEKSVDRCSCSSLVFIRRFKFSNYSSVLDAANTNMLFDIEYAFDSINDKYKDKSYGKDKYSKESMYWVGYIYRYISYTREISTKKTIELISPKELISNYYVYHTQSEEWVISRILELKCISEEYFSKDLFLRRKLKERYA